MRKSIARLAACVFTLLITANTLLAEQGQPEKLKLPNGLTLVVKSEPGSGLVALEAFVKAGVAQERSFEAGISNLTAKALLAGTRNLRAERLAQIADEVGGYFEVLVHPDCTEVRAVTTSSKFDEAMHLLGEVLTNANFDANAVEKAKSDTLVEAVRKKDEIFQTAYDELRLQLYNDNPYRRPSIGYPESIRKMGAAEVQEFFSNYYVPNNIIIAVAGDVTRKRVEERAKMAFAGIGSKQLPRNRNVPGEKMPQSRSYALQRDIRLAYLMIGFLAPGINSQDYPAMAVANAALGAGKSSRLFVNLREKKGIGYDLGTVYPRLKNQSHLLAYLITDPYKVDVLKMSASAALEDAKQALLSEINDMQEKPLSDEELTRAKRYCIGSYALEHQRLRERAFHLGWLEAVGPGYEFDSGFSSAIEAVTKADVQRVVSRYLSNYALVVIVPEIRSEEPA